MKAVTLKNLFGRKMLLPVSVKQLDEGGVSVLRDAATDEEFEITYTQLKRSSDAKGADRYFYGVCSFLANLAKVEPLALNSAVAVDSFGPVAFPTAGLLI